MAGWHHWLDGRESEWTPGVGDGQGGLACCDSWGRKESNTTEGLNWTENMWVKRLEFLGIHQEEHWEIDSPWVSVRSCIREWLPLSWILVGFQMGPWRTFWWRVYSWELNVQNKFKMFWEVFKKWIFLTSNTALKHWSEFLKWFLFVRWYGYVSCA